MEDIFIIMSFGFLAAFIDAIAGGGGLISLPALLFIGLPPQLALGTNKLGSSMGAFVSSITYLQSKHADRTLLRKLIPFTAIGAILGVLVLKVIPPDILRPLVIVLLLLITLWTIFKKPFQEERVQKSWTKGHLIILMGMSFTIGFYDGFFGPGTGSFLIFGFTLLGLSFLQGSANAKVLNFISNIVSLFTFMLLGLVDYQIGIAMGLAMIPGAYLGSRLAISKGSKLVKPVFISVTLFLISKQLFFS